MSETARTVDDRHPALLGRLEQRLGQSRTAAGDTDRGAAGELDAAVGLLELPLIERREAHAVPSQPAHGVGAAVDQQLRQLAIAALLGDAHQITEVLLARIGAEIDARALVRADLAGERRELIDAGIDRPHRADGKAAVAAALLEGSALEHHHRSALLARGQRRRQAGKPGTDHQHIGLRHRLSPAVSSAQDTPKIRPR